MGVPELFQPNKAMKLVTNMGYVFRLSEKAYRRVLRKIAQEKEFDLYKEGTCLGYIQENVTDMSAEEAADLLEDERKALREQKELSS